MLIHRIIYVPMMALPSLTPDFKHNNNGNGSDRGCLQRHKARSYDASGLLYGNGCKHYHDYFTYPFPPDACNYSLAKERYAKKKD